MKTKEMWYFIKSLVNLQQKTLAELFKAVSINYAFYSPRKIHYIFSLLKQSLGVWP